MSFLSAVNVTLRAHLHLHLRLFYSVLAWVSSRSSRYPTPPRFHLPDPSPRTHNVRMQCTCIGESQEWDRFSSCVECVLCCHHCLLRLTRSLLQSSHSQMVSRQHHSAHGRVQTKRVHYRDVPLSRIRNASWVLPLSSGAREGKCFAQATA